MIVFILEEAQPDGAFDIIGVVSKEDVASLFCDKAPEGQRRWRQKWLDDADLLYRISREDMPA